MLLKILAGNALICVFIAVVLYTMQSEKNDQRKNFVYLYKYALISSTAIIFTILAKWLIK